MRNTIHGTAAAALALLSVTALALPASAAPEPSVTGVVWADSDFDGVRDPGEPGSAGVTIAAYRDNNTQAASAVTDGRGHYALPLSGGPYTLRKEGLVPSKDDIALTVVPADVSVGKGQTFSVDLTVSNPGRSPKYGDWIEAGVRPGLRVGSAGGEGWKCTVTNEFVEYQSLRCDVAGFRRTDHDLRNNTATLRTRIR